MSFYRGYNTVGVTFGSTRLEDRELIKRDLLNHFNIRKGEKLMNPDFGSAIWDYLYEPLTEETKQSIAEDVTRIVNSDPRTNAQNMIITEYELGIQVEVELIYIQLDLSERLIFEFDNQASTVRVRSNR